MTRGLLEVDVPLCLKSGPTVLLHMKACLLTPDLHLSSPTLAFGPVQTSKCKVMLGVSGCPYAMGCVLAARHQDKFRILHTAHDAMCTPQPQHRKWMYACLVLLH